MFAERFLDCHCVTVSVSIIMCLWPRYPNLSEILRELNGKHVLLGSGLCASSFQKQTITVGYLTETGLCACMDILRI